MLTYAQRGRGGEETERGEEGSEEGEAGKL